MERTIRVTGKGKLSVRPDTTRLILIMGGIQATYGMALEQSAAMTEEMKIMFVGLGFQKDDLKTFDFHVNAKYESYQDQDKSWKKRFEGYKFVHQMKVEFPADNKRLGQILYALGHAAVRPEIQIEYTVAEPEKCKNELLADAVADSLQKADVLTKAAGVTLGDIVNIDYSWAELQLVSRTRIPMMLREGCMKKCEDSYDIDINPDDISVTDSVTIVWAIM